uniref:WD repeat domain 3 n=1 Tax=Salmo trutta TaxID=8032 RepID=A0A674DEH6_SALTR
VMAKKLKRAKKKARDVQDAEEEDTPEPVVERKLANEIVRLTNIKASAKIRWVDCLLCASGELKLAMLLQNNTVETYSLKTTDKNPTGTTTSRITMGDQGAHTLAFSSDNIVVLSEVPLCRRSTLQVIRTMACEYALCSLFVPGDMQIILGTKSGKIQIFYLASGTLLETVDAHNGALWSLCLSPDQRGIVTAEFQLIKDGEAAQKRLTVKHMRTLQLDEDVLCVKYSPDQRLLAVSLLDCTVKVFYTDTLKFFSLCMDTSSLAMIATGSADRNVKIWGLDFGNCHRSMFAHDDRYRKFCSQNHLFFTAGKEKKIKQWDAVKFEHIQTPEVTFTLIIKVCFLCVVSLSLTSRVSHRFLERPKAAQVAKKNIETVKAAELVMEELYRSEKRKMKEHQPASQPPSRYVIDVMKKAHSSELEVSLLVLPFPYIPDLLSLFNRYVQDGLEVELVCHFFLLRVHFGQISSNQMLPTVIDDLRSNTVSKSYQTVSRLLLLDVLGFNSAGRQFLQREVESKEDIMFFADAASMRSEGEKRAILTIA